MTNQVERPREIQTLGDELPKQMARGEARILTHVQVHGSYLLVSERLGDLLAFASRLEYEANKMREAAGK